MRCHENRCCHLANNIRYVLKKCIIRQNIEKNAKGSLPYLTYGANASSAQATSAEGSFVLDSQRTHFYFNEDKQ